MKPIHALLSFPLVAALLSGCAQNAPVASAPATNSAVANRLSLAEATTAVTKEIFREKPGMNPDATFPLKEITTAEVWDRLHAQVLVVTGDVWLTQCFIIRDGQVSRMGESFGGHGVMSMCVADLSGDGRPKLIFTHSSGSGLHRSQVAVWTGGPSWVDAKVLLLDGDLMVEKLDDGHVGLAYGEFSLDRSFKRQGEFGQLHLSADKPEPELDVELSPTLPDDIRKRAGKSIEQILSQ